MLEWWSAFNSGLSRRVLLAVGAAATLVLLSAVALVSQIEGSRQRTALENTLDGSANLFAGTLSARLTAADEIAKTMVAEDAGANGAALRARLKNARVFSGVFMLDADAAGVARAGAYEFHFSRAQLGTLI